MVENKNISAYTGAPPPTSECSRKIPGGPIYSLDSVRACKTAHAGGRKASNDIETLGYLLEDIPGIAADAVKLGAYKGAEWCAVGSRWVAADAYTYVETSCCEYTGKELHCDIYLKFAIASSGKIIIINSLHTSN